MQFPLQEFTQLKTDLQIFRGLGVVSCARSYMAHLWQVSIWTLPPQTLQCLVLACSFRDLEAPKKDFAIRLRLGFCVISRSRVCLALLPFLGWPRFQNVEGLCVPAAIGPERAHRACCTEWH